jgi:hypothetical protein
MFHSRCVPIYIVKVHFLTFEKNLAKKLECDKDGKRERMWTRIEHWAEVDLIWYWEN